jgi:hypothetical protein
MCKFYQGWQDCGINECRFFGDISGLCHNDKNKKDFNQLCPIKGYNKKENAECPNTKS